jgi:hypothetical protein
MFRVNSPPQLSTVIKMFVMHLTDGTHRPDLEAIDLKRR